VHGYHSVSRCAPQEIECSGNAAAAVHSWKITADQLEVTLTDTPAHFFVSLTNHRRPGERYRLWSSPSSSAVDHHHRSSRTPDPEGQQQPLPKLTILPFPQTTHPKLPHPLLHSRTRSPYFKMSHRKWEHPRRPPF
jgi:hypothetical protein